MADDLYSRLGVSREATREQIRAAFKRLSKKLHPDVAGPKKEDEFKAVAQAYEVLHDEAKRKRYDETGHYATAAEPTIDQKAMANIIGMFNELLNQHYKNPQIMMNDMTKSVSLKVEEQLAKFNAQVKETKRKAKKWRAIAARFKRKTLGENLIRRALEQQANDFERLASANQEQYAVGKRMLEILAEYDFERDPPPDVAKVVTWMMGSSTSSTSGSSF